MPRVTSGSSFGLLCALLLGSSCLLLTGCGMGTSAAPDPVPLTVNGRVHGGQQAVVGAQIQLYVAGNGGNGSASSPLLNTTVTSGTDGSFSITGDYSCPSATRAGVPGRHAGQSRTGLRRQQSSAGDDGSAGMRAAIFRRRSSSGLMRSRRWRRRGRWLRSRRTSRTSARARRTPTGLANAFLNAQLIANTATGTVATLPSNLTTEPGKIYALADAIASCINSDGTTGCSPLFTAATPSGGSAPTNTWDALMNIVKNPGNNVAGVFSAIGPQPPFATTLTQAPNDWTLSLTVTGGGMLAAGLQQRAAG